MVKELNLQAEKNTLKLCIQKNGNINWCTIHLINYNLKNEIIIGSDTFEIVKSKLLNALKNVDLTESKIMIENNKVFWIISFSETQTTVFCARNNEKIILYFLGDNEIIKGKMLIENFEVEKWIIKLSEITD